MPSFVAVWQNSTQRFFQQITLRDFAENEKKRANSKSISFREIFSQNYFGV